MPAMNFSSPRSPARRRSRRGNRWRLTRCRRCSARWFPRRSRRTTCTGARESFGSPGMSSNGASVGVSRLPVICGPTASGKSALALRLAEVTGAAIISADSRQVYRGFDIGTAKPTRVEQERVLHHGIDVVEPDERYSAADWAAAVPGWIADSESAGRRPIIVGGTGFYLRALFAPLFDEPAVDPIVRASVREVLGSMSGEEIKRWCEVLDPPRAALGRAQRERAVEVALITDRKSTRLHLERPRAAALTARYLLIDPGNSL